MACKWYDVACALEWLQSEIKAIAVWIWDGILSGLAAVIELIPVPDFLANVGVHTMPPGVSFFASALEIPLGLGIVVSAYTIRFIIRRLPIIG